MNPPMEIRAAGDNILFGTAQVVLLVLVRNTHDVCRTTKLPIVLVSGLKKKTIYCNGSSIRCMSAGYLFPEMSASGERIPKRRARPLSAKAMAARFKQHLEHADLGARHFTFHLFRVGCAVSQTIAGKDIAEIMAAVNWKSEKVARRYVGGATNTRDSTGTTPGAAEARYVTANDLAASLDPAVWAFPPPQP